MSANLIDTIQDILSKLKTIDIKLDKDFSNQLE